MTEEEKKQFFGENGYLLVPGILSAEEVSHMRKRVLEIFENGEWKRSPFNTDRVLCDIYDYFPEFIDLTLSSRVISEVKTILGEDPILMPETAIHYKLYTGWHKDTTSQEKAGHTFHLQPGSLMIEAGFYLQDNDRYGGGLTVMKGSHRTSDYFTGGMEKKRTLLTRVINKLAPTEEKDDPAINPHKHEIVNIPSKAGDLVIFNLRTNHRATLPQKGNTSEVPRQKEKLAFFNAFSSNHPSAKEYLDYICSRPEPFYQNLKNKRPNEKLLHVGKEKGFIVY